MEDIKDDVVNDRDTTRVTCLIYQHNKNSISLTYMHVVSNTDYLTRKSKDLKICLYMFCKSVENLELRIYRFHKCTHVNIWVYSLVVRRSYKYFFFCLDEL